jgi:hypothetical protein
MRLEVLMVVRMTILFWVSMPHAFIGRKEPMFQNTYCLHLQGCSSKPHSNNMNMKYVMEASDLKEQKQILAKKRHTSHFIPCLCTVCVKTSLDYVLLGHTLKLGRFQGPFFPCSTTGHSLPTFPNFIAQPVHPSHSHDPYIPVC